MPSVSVVLVTYQGARWVGPQAASIATQTRLPDEVVVADDGSTDDTVARALEALAPVADRVRVLPTDAHLGLTPNVERGLRAATGDVLVLADQDDVWLPHKLAAVERWAGADRTGGVFSDGWIIDADGLRTGDRLWARAGWDRRRRTRWRRDPLGVLLRQPLVTGAAMALRREALGLLLPLPEVGWHDYAMSLLLAATSGLTMIDEPLIEYRLHGANTAGLRPRSRRDRVLSREAQQSNLRGQVVLFEVLGARLAASGSAPTARRMAAKAATLRRRAALPDARLRRVGGVARLTATGDYHRYAQGWASAARDLFWP